MLTLSYLSYPIELNALTIHLFSYNRPYTGWVLKNLIQQGKQATLVSDLFYGSANRFW
jgi:hypothetical protein